MGCLLKVTGIFSLLLGVQLIHIQSVFATVTPQKSMQMQNYQPPNNGGPDNSRGAGTR